MNLRRDTARNLLRHFSSLEMFVTGVAWEISSSRIKPKTGEKLIIMYWANIERLKMVIEKALGGGIFF